MHAACLQLRQALAVPSGWKGCLVLLGVATALLLLLQMAKVLQPV
jgi:hypothetical protein